MTRMLGLARILGRYGHECNVVKTDSSPTAISRDTVAAMPAMYFSNAYGHRPWLKGTPS